MNFFDFFDFKKRDGRSQNAQILEYLQTGKEITPIEALRRFRCMRLQARIHDLEERGQHFIKGWLTLPNNKRVRTYRLVTYVFHANSDGEPFILGSDGSVRYFESVSECVNFARENDILIKWGRDVKSGK